MAPLLCNEGCTVAAAARCIQAVVASNAVTKVLPEASGGPGRAHGAREPPTGPVARGQPPRERRPHRPRGPRGPRGATGRGRRALPAQITQTVGPVVPWLFPPLGAPRACHARCARCARGCMRVRVLADGKAQGGQTSSVRERLRCSCSPVKPGGGLRRVAVLFLWCGHSES
jgi:hypothetical protein